MSKDSYRKANQHPSASGQDKLKSNAPFERDRREFMRFLSVGAGSAIVGGVFGCGGAAMAATGDMLNRSAVTKASALADDTAFWDKVRQAFIRPASEVVFNVDAGAVAPRIALTALQGTSKAEVAGEQAAEHFTSMPAQRSAIGSSLGAHADNTSLVGGATSGIMYALTGLNWSEGDVIFYTNHEHPNVIALIKSLQAFYKLVPVVISLPTNPHISAQEIAAAVESIVARHRPASRSLCALVWSSPTYQNGVMLPIARMANIARKFDLVSICDAAHLMGMASIDFHRMDIDFLSTCGHKWQCGPSLTGTLLRDARMAKLWRYNGNTAGMKSLSEHSFGAQVSMIGARSIERFESLVVSCTLWEQIGRSKIEAYSLSLAAYLKIRVERIWGESSIRSPLADPELFSAIISVDPFYDSELARQPNAYKVFAKELQSTHGFTVRAVKLPSGEHSTSAIRVSTPLWIDQSDVERLVDAMAAVANVVRSLPQPIEDPSFNYAT